MADSAAAWAAELRVRAHERATSELEAGRWSEGREQRFEELFEQTTRAALSVRQPAERSVVLRRLARYVPRVARPLVRRALRSLDAYLDRSPRIE